MIYTQLFNQPQDNVQVHKTILVGVIGTGHFATAVITQSQHVPRLTVPIVADIDVAAAQRAFQRAGIPATDVAICEDRRAVLAALDCGQRVVVPDALLLMDLPLHVIVESTGVPEAGARHAREAIRHGKHVVMVNKETDATVGPILAQMATQAGVVYTQTDGDQHGLLIALVQWARELGLEVLCGGKARDAEYVFDPQTSVVSCGQREVPLLPDEALWLQPVATGELKRHLASRSQMVSSLPQVGGYDLVEMAIAANATGLFPDRPLDDESALHASRRLATDARLTNRGAAREEVRRSSSQSEAGRLHCPPLYTREIPHVLAPRDHGGILAQSGVIEAVTCLRYPHEAGLGGGVFIVVACENDYSRHILTSKGLLANSRDTTALIYRPYHLCGVETPISILCAGLLGIATAASQPQQRVDVVARTTRTLHAGETVGNDHSPDLEALMTTAHPVGDGAPLPFHMANGNRLRVDVCAGTVITADMVEPPRDSVLWALRAEQDRQQ